MGTLAVGSGAYALMPGETCTPTSPGLAASGEPQANAASCASRSSSLGGSSNRSSRFSFFGGSSSARSSSSPSDPGSSSVSRGGFGSFARAFGFSGRG
jgi:hypothetical protein